MLVLALDTSSSAVTVALADLNVPDEFVAATPESHGRVWLTPPRVLAERSVVATNRHGELLAPLIAEALAEAGVAANELEAVGVGLGPGPFTGLRVGIMTAKSMADALAIPVFGECSLDVMARGASSWNWAADENFEAPFAVVSDARRKQVYWATYDYDGCRELGPELAPPAEVAEALRAQQIMHVAGAGAHLYADVFAGFDMDDDNRYPSAGALPRLAVSKLLQMGFRGRPSDDLTPMYLRRPDAVPPSAPKQVTPS